MTQFMLLLVTVASTWFLIKGADLLVDGAAGLADRLGIPKVIVGATIVSLGTTSPEAAVSVMAAWEGHSGLALGNAVGSIVADTGLIFGLGCVLTVLPADRFVLRRQGWVKIATGLILAAGCYGLWALQGNAAAIQQPAGFVLLLLLAAYLYVSVTWARQHPEPYASAETTEPASGPSHERSTAVLTGLMAGGLLLVVLSSRFLIGSASELAVRWGLSQVVIAATLVAVGTSLPELVVGMTAIIRGHKELLVGNVIGADILNVLFVIGASAAATDLPIIDPAARIPQIFLYLHLPFMIAMMLLFLGYILVAVRTGHFRRWMGVPLLVLYALYIVLLLALGQAA